MLVLLWFLSTLSLIPVDVLAVTCNACVSELDPDCDSVLAYNPPTCSDASCVTFVGTADGARIVARSCRRNVVTGCNDVEYVADDVHYAGTLCSCVTDYCNGGKFDESNPAGNSVATRTPTGDQTVTCYKCSSLLDSSNCGDKLIVSPRVQTCVGAACVVVAGIVDGKYVVGRECSQHRASTGCSRTTTNTGQITVDGTVCYCNNDRCNANGPFHSVRSVGCSSKAIISLLMSALFGSLFGRVVGLSD